MRKPTAAATDLVRVKSNRHPVKVLLKFDEVFKGNWLIVFKYLINVYHTVV